jgi:two-component system LytT family response regulator
VTLLRALVVEDERLARRDLAAQLAGHPQVQVVGEADSVAQAVRLYEALAPNLLFLDIELPDGSGFDVLAKTREGTRAVFVTAHDRYAVRAFEVNALDYLLKPVEPARLRQALARLSEPEIEPTLPPLAPDDRFCATDGAFRGFVAVRSIRRVSVYGNYTQVYTTEGRELEVKQSLQVWERRLPAEQFARINRNDLVQIALVTRLLPASAGYTLYLAGELEPRPVSRRALSLVRERLRGLLG